MPYPDLVEPDAHFIVLSQHPKRSADRAINIAQDVFFLVEARIVIHQGS